MRNGLVWRRLLVAATGAAGLAMAGALVWVVVHPNAQGTGKSSLVATGNSTSGVENGASGNGNSGASNQAGDGNAASSSAAGGVGAANAADGQTGTGSQVTHTTATTGMDGWAGASSGQPAGPHPASPGDPITAVTANAPSPVFLGDAESIHVTIYNKNGATMSVSGHHVSYQVVSGPSGASVSSDGHFSAVSPGMYTVDAAVDGIPGNQVTIVEQAALQVQMTLTNTTLAGPGQVSQASAHVTSGQWTDQTGVTVHFSVPQASPVRLSSTQAITDANGIASVDVTSPSSLRSKETVTITASISDGKSASAPLVLDPKPIPPAKIVPYSVPNYITSSGTIISLTVEDTNGNKLQGVTLIESVSGAQSKLDHNNFGDNWLYIFPNAGVQTVHAEVSVPGTNVTWTFDIPVHLAG